MFGSLGGSCPYLSDPCKASVWGREEGGYVEWRDLHFHSSLADTWPAAWVLGLSCPLVKGGAGGQVSKMPWSLDIIWLSLGERFWLGSGILALPQAFNGWYLIPSLGDHFPMCTNLDWGLNVFFCQCVSTWDPLGHSLGTSSAGSYYVCLSQRCSRMAHFQRGLGVQGSGEEKKDGEEQEKAPVARATEE